MTIGGTPLPEAARAEPLPPGADALLAVLEAALDRQASDVIVTAGSPILWRLDGVLRPATKRVLDTAATQSEVYGILSSDQIARLESERELDFSLQLAHGRRFRGNAYFQRAGVAAAFRPVPARIPSLRELGLPESVAKLSNEAQGLVLVVGPTGHGKSTTLAALVAEINATRHVHVITIEDPIEFEHAHGRSIIDQREVGSDTLSFAEALRRVLRQSPDVILVGEMRDQETVAAALTAAETGHLVLATLHTNDAAQSIDRMIDVFPPMQQPQVRGQLSQVLLAVISQRLLAAATGAGRVLATEVLLATPAVRHMIRDDKLHGIVTAIETGANVGMQTLDQSLRTLVRKGLVARDVALPYARDPDRVR